MTIDGILRHVVCVAAGLALGCAGLGAAEAPKPAARPVAPVGITTPSPKAVKKVDAKYPVHMKESDVEGWTEVKAMLHQDGTVGTIQPVACQATKGGKPLAETAMKEACKEFVDASRQAFAQWRYPAQPKGAAVVVTGRFKFVKRPNPPAK